MMDELSELYLAYCRDDVREPPNTLIARNRVLKSIGYAGTATREQVETWWAGRAHLTAGTRIADLALLRSFYKWAMIYEHRTDDPTVRIRSPRAPRRVPHPARRADVSRLLKELPEDLARAVVLGAFLGFRVSESAALDWASVDVDRGLIRVERSKGDRTRIVPVAAATLKLLGEQLPEGNVVRPGNPYTAAVLGRKLNRAMRAAGVKATSHQLRHLFGTTAYEASGGDILAVRDLMGHESTQTTAGYAQPSADVARRIAEAVISS